MTLLNHLSYQTYIFIHVWMGSQTCCVVEIAPFCLFLKLFLFLAGKFDQLYFQKVLPYIIFVTGPIFFTQWQHLLLTPLVGVVGNKFQ